MSFTLGVNFPWVTCGHDFGPRPPPWAGAPGTDWAAVEDELRGLAAAGLRAARWWILAGGVNLPIGASPLEVARRAPFLERWPRAQLWKRRLRKTPEDPEHWILERPLPRAPRTFLEDFDALLAACARTGVRLIPSLVSFELFLPLEDQASGVTSRGRDTFALGDSMHPFFDALLEPMLDVAERRPDGLAAFEVANEPGWALVPGWEKDRYGAHPPWVDALALSRFLEEGARRIARRGIVATVGFLDPAPPWLAPSARTTLARLAASGRYVHQRHHYPGVTGVAALPPADTSPIRPIWLGELATSRHGPWPDLDEGDDHVAQRLEHVRARGYDGALLWAHRATDPHVRWDADIRAQVRRVADAIEVG